MTPTDPNTPAVNEMLISGRRVVFFPQREIDTPYIDRLIDPVFVVIERRVWSLSIFTVEDMGRVLMVAHDQHHTDANEMLRHFDRIEPILSPPRCVLCGATRRPNSLGFESLAVAFPLDGTHTGAIVAALCLQCVMTFDAYSCDLRPDVTKRVVATLAHCVIAPDCRGYA
jgi:hypothetical protein